MGRMYALNASTSFLPNMCKVRTSFDIPETSQRYDLNGVHPVRLQEEVVLTAQ